MARRFFALMLVVLAVLPFSAPFSTCPLGALDDLAAEQTTGRAVAEAQDSRLLHHGRTLVGAEEGAVRRESLHQLVFYHPHSADIRNVVSHAQPTSFAARLERPASRIVTRI